MSFLLDKSEQNKVAFNYLIEMNLNAAAVHCCYYSCIQRIIYILKEYYTDEYNSLIKGNKGGRGNTHRQYIMCISEKLSKNSIERVEFRTKLLEIKDIRIDADYRDLEITSEQVEKVKDNFGEIQRKIKKVFKV